MALVFFIPSPSSYLWVKLSEVNLCENNRVWKLSSSFKNIINHLNTSITIRWFLLNINYLCLALLSVAAIVHGMFVYGNSCPRRLLITYCQMELLSKVPFTSTKLFRLFFLFCIEIDLYMSINFLNPTNFSFENFIDPILFWTQKFSEQNYFWPKISICPENQNKSV